MMTQAQRVDAMYRAGRRQAIELQGRAAEMTGTEIIDQERNVPAFDPEHDYSGWPVGAPVADEGQVWLLIQPYNAAYYQGRPATLRALWGLAHTTDPTKAKPWVDAYGTSGMYMAGECYKSADGVVHRCLNDNTIYDAEALPSVWEDVIA